MADQESQGKRGTYVAGLLFWAMVIFAPLAYMYPFAEEAEVFLNVSTDQTAQLPPFMIEGKVILGGSPVADGVVHVVVVEAKKKRYLTSVALNVDKDGKFGPAQLPVAREKELNTFKITANFRGQLGKEKKPVVAESTVYVNYPPPLGTRTVWGLLGTLVLLGLALIYLFTTEMTRLKLKILYGAMYFITFMSLAVPIAVTVLVAQSSYLVELMAEAPIGLVKGKAPGVDAPQWLINIGGIVHDGAAAATPAPTDRIQTSAPVADRGASTADTTSPAAISPAVKPEAVPKTSATSTVAGAASPKSPSVEGGLAIPFYVILLAMFGAAINMTLKVPQIQGDFQEAYEKLPTPEPVWRALLNAFIRRDDSRENYPTLAISQIRRKLIQNFMYLMSAPFLAIAVYYLLQVIANQVAQPMLVVMGFATGLTSDTIVRSIIHLAKTSLSGQAKAEAEAEAEVAKIKVAAQTEIAKSKTAAEIANAKKEKASAEEAQLRAEQDLAKTRAQVQPKPDAAGAGKTISPDQGSKAAESAAVPSAKNEPKSQG